MAESQVRKKYRRRDETPAQESSRLFVSDLPKHTTEMDLRECFSEFGEVTDVHILQQRAQESRPSQRKSRKCGFVGFASIDSARRVMAAPKIYLGTRGLRVRYADMKQNSAENISVEHHSAALKHQKRGLTGNEESKQRDSETEQSDDLTEHPSIKIPDDCDNLGIFIRGLPFEMDESALFTWIGDRLMKEKERLNELLLCESNQNDKEEDPHDSQLSDLKSVKKDSRQRVKSQLEKLEDTTIDNVKLLCDSFGKSKGFGMVRFRNPYLPLLFLERNQLSKDSDFCLIRGRRVYVNPLQKSGMNRGGIHSHSAGMSKVEPINPDELDDVTKSKLSFKQLRLLKQRWKLHNGEELANASSKVWNPLMLSNKTVISETVEALANGKNGSRNKDATDLLGIEDTLSESGGISKKRGVVSAAVNVTLAETGVSQHCADWLRSEGIDVDHSVDRTHSVVRSRTMLLIKNIDVSDYTKDKLKLLMKKHLTYGVKDEPGSSGNGAGSALKSLRFPPKSSAVALAAFSDARFAQVIFERLSYFKLKQHSSPLYLEFAPLMTEDRKRELQKKQGTSKKRNKSEMNRSDDPSEENSDNCKLCVKNLAFESTPSEIRKLFDTFGKVKRVRVPQSVAGKHHRGFAFVEFETRSEAQNALLALTHSHFYGRKLVCQWAK